MAQSDEMRPAGTRLKLTYDDFVLFPDDGKRHELIDGEHYVTPSPNIRHQAILWNLTGMIAPYLKAHSVGRAFYAPLDVVFSDFDVVEPDLLFVSKARQDEILTPKHLRGAPDLVVEVVSPSTRQRDETLKRRLYERFGVSEYWTIDPRGDTIAVDRYQNGQYVRVAHLSRAKGDTLTTTLLPGLEMPLAEIFED